MALPTAHLYRFGPFHLDLINRLLLRDGRPVQLAPKAFDTLLALINNRERVVEKDELLRMVWPDSFVEEINLTVHISALRKALGDSPNEQQYIATVPKRGYRFVAAVSEAEGEKSEALPNTSSRPSARPWKPTRSAIITLVLLCLAGVLPWLWLSKARQPKTYVAIRSIAVLPFKVLGPDKEEYFEIGMADALITRLSNLEQISVLPTSAILSYTEQAYDPVLAGRQLGVDAVVESTLQLAGQHVRVTVQLVNTRDGKPLWAERFDEKFTNVFAVQDSISEQVADALSLRLSSNRKAQVVKHHTQSPEAYQAYLQGIFFWNKRTQEALKKSIEHFEKAIEKDPDYALAYAGLADATALLFLGERDGAVRDKAAEQVEAAAAKALEIDETIAEAHIAMAMVKFNYGRDMSSAEREYKRAIELNPNYSTAYQRYAWFLHNREQVNRAAQMMQRAVELDPLSVVNNMAFASLLYQMTEYDRAVEQCKRALELDPDYDIAHHILGLAYERKGVYERAIAEIEKATEKDRTGVTALESRGHIYAVSGRRAEAQKVISELRRLSVENAAALYGMALIYVGLGERGRAFAWLEKAARGGVSISLRARTDPRMKEIREDHRFARILSRLKAAHAEKKQKQ